MTNAAESLNALKAHFDDISVYLPEVRDELVALHVALTQILALNLRAPNRLMGLDLQNMVTNVEKTICFKKEGVQNAHLQNAVTDIRVLALYMHERAQNLIAQESQMLSINANVSTHRVGAAPMDLTEQMEKFSIRPTLTLQKETADAPLAAIPTAAFLDAPGVRLTIQDLYNTPLMEAFGRVSGECYSYCANTKIHAIEHQSSILPAGCMVVVQPGKAFSLFFTNSNVADRFTPPRGYDPEEPLKEQIFEAGSDGAVIYGPAAFKMRPALNGVLNGNLAMMTAWHDAHTAKIGASLKDAKKSQEATSEHFFQNCFMGAFFTVVSPISAYLTSEAPSLSVAIAGGIAFFAATRVVQAFKNSKDLKRKTSNLQTYQEAIASQPDAFLKMAQHPAFGASSKSKKTPEEAYEFCAKLAGATKTTNGMNFRPGITIEASSLDDVNLLTPLLALPSPSMVAQPLDLSKQTLPERTGDFGGKRTII